MQECDKHQRYFSEYVDGELGGELRRVIEKHLSECPGCNETVQRIIHVRNSLGHLTKLSTSPGFEARLHERLNHSPQRGWNLLQVRGRMIEWKVPALSALALVLMISSLWFFNSSKHDVDLRSPQESSFPSGISTKSDVLENGATVAAPSPAAATNAVKTDSLQKDAEKSTKKDIKLVNEHLDSK